MPSPKIDRQISDCLADDLQVPDDRILHHRIRKGSSPNRVGDFQPSCTCNLLICMEKRAVHVP
jgi:hypothetical protein